MKGRGVELRRLGCIGLGLVLLGVAGFLLSACGGGGGGDALATRTDVTATRTAGTVTRPTRTATRPAQTHGSAGCPSPGGRSTATTASSNTSATPTACSSTTSPATPTPTATARRHPRLQLNHLHRRRSLRLLHPLHRRHRARPRARPRRLSPTTARRGAGSLSPPGRSEPRSSGSCCWRRRQSAAARWAARLDDLTRRTFPTLDAVLAEGSLVTGQVQALSAEAATLVAEAPDEQARAEAGRLGAALDELSAHARGRPGPSTRLAPAQPGAALRTPQP